METIPAVVVDAVDPDDELKRKFAVALLKHPATPDGRFAAALSVTPDTGKALLMANRWLDDPIITAAQAKLSATDDDDGLNVIFSKMDLARLLWNKLNACYDNDSFAKLSQQAMMLRGWNKPDSVTNVQVNNNKVLVVREAASNAEWEDKARKQQRALIDVAASAH
jgi:hypothetical protein